MLKNPTYKFYEYNHLRTDGTTSLRIAAVSSFAGKPVKGYADCHPNDEFDREYGYALAAARCAEKIAKFREDALIFNGKVFKTPEALENTP